MLVALLLLACHTEPDKAAPAAATGEGLFLAGCPEEGAATARVLTEIAERPWGPDALAAPGDVLLMNERAAFVLQDPTAPRTYYHYGGLPIDAVAVAGCEQAGPERFGEVGLIVGQLDLASFTQSSLHMVRGETMTVVSDGSDGGPAIVEVTATDDRFWLVELTLMRYAWEDGGRKELGELYGLDLTLRYTLAPDDAALQLEVLVDGAPAGEGYLVGGLLFPSDHTEQTRWASGDLSVGGIGLDVGIPWIEDASAEGSTAFTMRDATLALTEISGVTAVLDVGQVGEPLGEGDAAGFLFGVGATDGASASAALEPHLVDPVPGYAATWHDVSGIVTGPDGAPASGVTVAVQAPHAADAWDTLTTFVTDAGGRFGGRAVAVEGTLRLYATAPGRDAEPPVVVDPTAATGLALAIGAEGAVVVNVTDEAGDLLPVRVELERADGTVVEGYASAASPTIPVPPGEWTAYVTRGYEWSPLTTTVTVAEGAVGRLDGALTQVVDTTGWASYDSHVHTGPSPDSDTLPVDRMLTAAASGLDLVISTDHEAIVDVGDAVGEAGLTDRLAYALGSEVTASLPEHTNAWPFPTSDGPRGEPVRWYGKGFPGIYAAERDRGARVVQLNHARVNGECGILCILDWDRLSDPPAADDLAALGVTDDDAIWSWDFDAFEVLNGLRSPYLGDDPRRSGALYDWLAFHNLGYPVTAVGVTDIHGMGTPGTPRTYVQVPDDAAVTAEDAADATLAGAAQVSAGAFARVSIDGAGPGETVSVEDGVATVVLEVQALPGIDVTRVDVLVDCDLAASVPADAPDAVTKLATTLDLPVAGDHHVVVIALGEGAMPRGLEGYDATKVPRVLVNPVFVDGDGDGLWTAPGPKTCDWRP